jgi:NADH dehydrogenase
MTRPDPGHSAVLVVGGGFGGLGAALELARHGVDVRLVDRNDYHQFQPLLYQVATAQIAAADVATPLRSIFARHRSVDVKQAEVVSIDPAARAVTTADGLRWTGGHLVLAAGSRARFFGVAGAAEHSFPLYGLRDAQRLRSRVFEVFEAVDRQPHLAAEGALNLVVVGGGATGVEIAGSLADLVARVLPGRYRDLPVRQVTIHLVDHGRALLGPFSPSAHRYAARMLHRAGVRLLMGRSVREVTPTGVRLDDGSSIASRCVVWAGGLAASPLAGDAGLPLGQGGRVAVAPDLSVPGHPGVFALGDAADVPGPDGNPLPQLGSVALQSGRWVAGAVRADRAGAPRRAFHYRDKGIMAMIGRGAAVAEVGPRRRELHGPLAFAAWLGVHVWLLSGARERADALVSWGWDLLSRNRAPAVIDRPDAADIDWSLPVPEAAGR